jgi:hypothetical protein
MGADAGRLDFTAPVLVADHIERCASSEPTSGRLLADSASEHCVIRGTPLNFRSRSTSCPIEADAGTGEFDPKPTSKRLIKIGAKVVSHGGAGRLDRALGVGFCGNGGGERSAGSAHQRLPAAMISASSRSAARVSTVR